MDCLTWTIGDITITRLVESSGTGPMGGADSFLSEAYPHVLKTIDWLIPDFVNEEGHARFSLHALLVQTPTYRLIVDTCVGNDKDRVMPFFNKLSTSFLADLEALGWSRDSVDGVLCTHLHVDHVGWNTMLVDGQWVPTFPKAQYFIARSEYLHWQREVAEMTADEVGVRAIMDTRATFADSVKPVIDAGLEVLVDCDAPIVPGIRLIPTPGHTPGHVSVVIESNGERAIITGDMMHHPCQVARPEWAAAFDSDAQESTATRLAFFQEYADTPTLVIGTHFGGPTAGYLKHVDGGYQFRATSAP
jgi:glyoxylase-like metal-dependent hydrolase (beta-lactamase superfamily II)